MKRLFKITSNVADNWLCVQYAGRVGVADVEACHERIVDVLSRLEAGFLLIVDLSELESMDIACAPHLAKIMDSCRERGVGRVLRIIPNPARDIGLNILSVFHYGHTVPIVVTKSIDEAEKILKFRLMPDEI